ncbi:hypothetical protein LZ30DRAFT_690694 [Colletotrichum cereale]|nr:hypothetical protein LZ30DRAFT_690694 [Colletotrichum cereale]
MRNRPVMRQVAAWPLRIKVVELLMLVTVNVRSNAAKDKLRDVEPPLKSATPPPAMVSLEDDFDIIAQTEADEQHDRREILCAGTFSKRSNETALPSDGHDWCRRFRISERLLGEGEGEDDTDIDLSLCLRTELDRRLSPPLSSVQGGGILWCGGPVDE